MNKKILIGSIVMVTVLIGVSFTSVIGYRSISSDVKVSPLFNMRISRALDKESKDLTSNYIGKGEESVLSIPKRNDRTILIQRFIDMISKTDDNTLNVYINLIINQMQKKYKYDDVNINEVITAIHRLRDNPDIISLNVNKNGNFTWRDNFICYIYWILEGILFFIFLIPIVIVTRILFTHLCHPSMDC